MICTDAPAAIERVKLMNPVVLAFVGDAAYTLLVREKLALASACKAGGLNKKTAEIVSARGQSSLLERALPRFTEEESEIYHRGRNAHKPTKSKNASPVDYARATGMEAVVGYLYLTGNLARIKELFFAADEA